MKPGSRKSSSFGYKKKGGLHEPPFCWVQVKAYFGGGAPLLPPDMPGIGAAV